METQVSWPSDLICLQASGSSLPDLASRVYQNVCRTDFDEPGFCLINAGRNISSVDFRRMMVDLKTTMAGLHESKTGHTFAILSAARFDQQTTTRPHLDGGPEECFLMLGYEPTKVDAELELADYSKCAFDRGMTPQEFMARHNPMFQAGYDLVQPYSTRLPCFSKSDFQIVCINNSSASFDSQGLRWQGVLHTATILTPDESKRRVINSMMIANVPVGTADAISNSEIEDFIQTSLVRRKGYDKTHLEEDV